MKKQGFTKHTTKTNYKQELIKYKKSLTTLPQVYYPKEKSIDDCILDIAPSHIISNTSNNNKPEIIIQKKRHTT